MVGGTRLALGRVMALVLSTLATITEPADGAELWDTVKELAAAIATDVGNAVVVIVKALAYVPKAIVIPIVALAIACLATVVFAALLTIAYRKLVAAAIAVAAIAYAVREATGRRVRRIAVALVAICATVGALELAGYLLPMIDRIKIVDVAALPGAIADTIARAARAIWGWWGL